MNAQIHLSQLAEQEHKPGLIHWANLLYALIFMASVLIAVLPAGSTTDQTPLGLDPALLTIIAQVGGVLLPSLLFIWLTRQTIQTTLKLRRLSFGNGVKCFVIGLLCWPLTILAGNLGAILTMLINPQAHAGTDIITRGGSPWLAFLALVFVAPLFEELLFRGVMLGAYEESAGSHAIWLVALLFAFYHFTLGNFLLPLIVGLIAGWLVYRTRSIWSGILVHMGANLLAGLLILLNVLAGTAGAEAAEQNTSVLTLDVLWLGVLIWAGMSVLFFVPVFFLLRSIGKRYSVPQQPTTDLSLKDAWSTIVVSLGAAVYFGIQLMSWVRR